MAGDFNKPALADTYTLFASAVRDLCADIAKGLDPALSLGTANIPANTIRWNSANGYWEKFNGSVWGVLASTYAINVSTANAWATGRTIALTSDITGTSAAWTGSGNISFATTLATVNSNVGAFGSALAVPVITVNGKGLITAVSTATIGTMAAQSATTFSIGAAGSVATLDLSNTGSTLKIPQSTTQAPVVEGSIGWDTNDDKLVIGDGVGTKVFTPDDLAATLTNKTMGSGCTWNGTTVGVGYGGTGATSFTSGGILRGNGGSALSIASGADIAAAIGSSSVTNAGTSTVGATVTLTADNTTAATRYPLFASAATGNLSPMTDTGYTYNPSTGALTATTFAGSHTGTFPSAQNNSSIAISAAGVLSGAGGGTVTRAGLGAAASGAVTASGITQNTERILGRTTAAAGAIEEITVSTGLSLTGGTLSCTVTSDVTSVGGYTGAVTAANLLTSIKTVDGSGSGLDADLLDGQSSAYYATAASVTAKVSTDVGAGSVGGFTLLYTEDVVFGVGTSYSAASVNGYAPNPTATGTLRCITSEYLSPGTLSLFQRIS